MASKLDLAGQQFGNLTVVDAAGRSSPDGQAMWNCLCVCGRARVVIASSLRTGHTRSCGCSRRTDLAGRRVGLLVVLGPAPSRKKRAIWHCRCDCGVVKEVRASALLTATTVSCGCFARQVTRERSRVPGTGTGVHFTWMSMISRTTNPNNHAYPRYGGRGIKVCNRWRVFSTFYADMSPTYQDGLSINRIDTTETTSPRTAGGQRHVSSSGTRALTGTSSGGASPGCLRTGWIEQGSARARSEGVWNAAGPWSER